MVLIIAGTSRASGYPNGIFEISETVFRSLFFPSLVLAKDGAINKLGVSVEDEGSA